MSNITFVDKDDNIIGYGTKSEAKEQGIIHRVVRIYVVNSSGEILIQKRSAYVDIPYCWDQSAAGHVDEGEDYDTAASRELQEEVGIAGVPLTKVAKYYSEESDTNAVRKRFNTLYTATYDGDVQMNPREVSEIKWIQPAELEQWMHDKPQEFTQGFLESYKQYATIE